MNITYYDYRALIDRLTYGVKSQKQKVTFLLGSALSYGHAGTLGVPSAADVVEMVRLKLSAIGDDEFETRVRNRNNPYQAALDLLLGWRGPAAVSQVVKEAVLRARANSATAKQKHPDDAGIIGDEICQAFDTDWIGWQIPPGLKSIAELITSHPENFNQTILTTNFDPLIEASFLSVGARYHSIILHSDGSPSQTLAEGCQVIHLHGFWHGSDTLHTPRQLLQPRPRLQASISNIIRNQLLVVVGYGGWDDIFTEALVTSVVDDQYKSEVIWTNFEVNPTLPANLQQSVSNASSRGRFNFYSGIDCNILLPDMLEKWRLIEAPVSMPPLAAVSDQIELPDGIKIPEFGGDVEHTQISFDRTEQDRPPTYDVYVGRVDELDRLIADESAVTFITGIGGQGKSALAAKYYGQEWASDHYHYRVWRDCKEESERFESQIVSIIEALTGGIVSRSELVKLSIEELAKNYLDLTKEIPLLLVFDNIDHYVDLERCVLGGSPKVFIDALCESGRRGKVIFTCRPDVQYSDSAISIFKLQGLDLGSAQELFRKRRAICQDADIEAAHTLTSGHALWLDLLASQSARDESDEALRLFIRSASVASADLPTTTLQAIWQSLKEREKIVLRALAETVRPTTQLQLGDYLSSKINYKNIGKAVRALRDLNLLVVKRLVDAQEALELHPVVRGFIRKTFQRSDRIWYIDAILGAYRAFFGVSARSAARVIGQSVVRGCTEAAELCIEAGKIDEAFLYLKEIGRDFGDSEDPSEFIRVTRGLFDVVEWGKLASVPGADAVVEAYSRTLSNMGRFDDCFELLEKYKDTVVEKGTRYILYCDLQCYLYWISGSFGESLKWGTLGVDLKTKTGVDTKHDCSHNLALSQRDAGMPHVAIQYFLHGRELADVISPKAPESERGGNYYGNIGRCLHFMGQVEPALVCYKKSAIILEDDSKSYDATNQGYIRLWAGEILLERGDVALAHSCFIAAIAKWRFVMPTRAEAIRQRLLTDAEVFASCPSVTPVEADKRFLGWVFGRSVSLIAV